MKLAFISTILHHAWGGADALWTLAAEAALDRGDQVLLAVSEIVLEHPRVQALKARGAQLLVRRRTDRPPTTLQRVARKVREVLKREDLLLARVRVFAPDLVILSGGGTYDPILEAPLCAWLTSSGTRFRVIANFQHEHPQDDEHSRCLAHEILRTADRIFFVSPRNLDLTRRHLLDPLPRAECIHGVMVHNEVSSAAPPAWPPEHIWSMAVIARLEPVKGIDLLIQSLALGLGDVAGWRLQIYGRGQQHAYLQQCADYFSLGTRVFVRGFVASLDEVYATNHLLVSPSVNEGVPMTIPEAMLRGRAVLAARIGAAEEWIEHGHTGFLCAAPTRELFAACLREAWDVRGRWRTMGENAQVAASARYRPDDFLRIIAPPTAAPTRPRS